RQGRTGHRRVDLGDLDRALGPAPGAIESYGDVRRIAELQVVSGVIRQCSQARAARAHVHVEPERVGAGLKIHAAVRDTTIEQRAGVVPHVEQTADVEPTCLDVPRAAYRIRQLADGQAVLWLPQGEPEALAETASNVPGSGRRADPDPRWACESGGANCESQ